MADDATRDPTRQPLLERLSPEERADLDQMQFVKTGEHLIWIEPDGAIRREKLAKLYYVRTGRGVFRVSRLTGEVVEV